MIAAPLFVFLLMEAVDVQKSFAVLLRIAVFVDGL